MGSKFVMLVVVQLTADPGTVQHSFVSDFKSAQQCEYAKPGIRVELQHVFDRLKTYPPKIMQECIEIIPGNSK